MSACEIDLFLKGIVLYHEEFRVALFVSGFTIGSFLFSMKSVIVKTMKEEFYEQKEYQDNITQRIYHGQKIGYYTQLKNFSLLISLSIGVSILSAVFQVTIGYTSNPYLVMICLFSSFLSWVLVSLSVYWSSRNWSILLDNSEKKAQKDLRRNK